ncbi:DUF3857 domain-containing protein [Robiginitalea sp. M366]|uniref:DUF3857 domain-containing protein n=1 Tax=Robiginitalea aestuariiviva TaxID=3036903 RepID=UPI00240E5F99|nr:DUF3857 domain-containing protein [Robiginitalea aestuariiviva]MDG1572195.1 DUF3857 domain-containing protein [Robiginitalea aestuariiviva]
MKNFTALLIFLLVLVGKAATAQSNHTYGQLNPEEKSFGAYEADTTAAAVYLYERGDNYFDVDGSRIWLYKKYHAKIKVLKEEGFDYGTISIPYYRGESTSEKVMEVRAMTHNGTVRIGVEQNQIFNKDLGPNWSEITFSFPKIQVGSVLEYTYLLRSPYIYNFNGWDFQESIPKVYTEFNASIPGNYYYNRALIGTLTLAVNEAELEKGCLRVPGISKPADCEKLRYAMEDVPAFVEEPFMLGTRNYKSRMVFELAEWRKINGEIERFTQSWEDVDKEMRTDSDLGRQLKKETYFEKQVPPTLLSTGEPLERARNIYEYVRTHFNWTGSYGVSLNSRVKDAFDQGSGSVAEINMTLINLLNAGGIPAELVMSATRRMGLPKRSHPVMSDFNYVLARAEIDGKTYYMDATDKYIPFGMLPFRCLNYYGRVMDFENESYWEDFNIESRNQVNVRAQLLLEADGMEGSGVMYWLNTGYPAVDKRRKMAEEEDYQEELEEGFREDIEVTSLGLDAEKSTETSTYERLDFRMENEISGDRIYLDPFLIRFFSRNPFTLNQRTYPVDFGYARAYVYSLSITLPEGFTVESLPEPLMTALPDGLGHLMYKVEERGGNVLLTFNFNLKTPHYTSELYPALKSLFDEAVRAQTQSLIVLARGN